MMMAWAVATLQFRPESGRWLVHELGGLLPAREPAAVARRRLTGQAVHVETMPRRSRTWRSIARWYARENHSGCRPASGVPTGAGLWR